MGILLETPCEYDEEFSYPLYFHYSLIATGAWPTEIGGRSFGYRLLEKLYIVWNWFNIGCVAFVAVTEFAYFVINVNDLTKAVDSLSTVMAVIMINARFAHMRIVTDQVKTLLILYAKNIWIKRKSHPKIYDLCFRRTRPTFYLSMALWGTYILYNIMPIVEIMGSDEAFEDIDKKFPYSMAFPYDTQRKWPYILTYILTLYSGLVMVLQVYGMDTLMALCLNFLTGQFELLHGEILRLIPECHAEWQSRGGDVSEAVKGRNLQQLYIKRLNEIAAHHNNLISFCMKLDDFVTVPLLIIFLCASLVICFIGFQFMTLGTKSFEDFMLFLLYFLSIAGQLFVICNMGTVLVSRSTETAECLFICNWEGGTISNSSPLLVKASEMESNILDEKLPQWRLIHFEPTNVIFQHHLRLMIMRSHRPLQLTAMKYAVLSLETFNQIISTSMSYFALLNTIVEKQN